MRYLVTARVKPGKEAELLQAIEDGTLGAGSVAGDEYLRNMQDARLCSDDKVKWVEVCFCDTPLAEEREYWEPYFDLVRVQDAHARQRCRDLTAPSRGPAASATARPNSKRNWQARARHSWRHCGNAARKTGRQIECVRPVGYNRVGSFALLENARLPVVSGVVRHRLGSVQAIHLRLDPPLSEVQVCAPVHAFPVVTC